MSKPAKGGLGRGLGSLVGGAPVETPPAAPAHTQPRSVPTPAAPVVDRVGDSVSTLVPTPGAVYLEVPVGDISPNPRQPRTVFDDEALAELVHSIKEIGLLQPVVVRRAGSKFELIAGERRWRACQQAGLKAIPAIVRDTTDDELLREALLENLHRAQLNPLEEAAAYQQMLDDFGCTQEELSARIGRSRPQISNTLRLLKLPTSVARRVAAGVITSGHAKVLLSLTDDQQIETLANRVISEGLSVRALEELITLGAGNSAQDATPKLKRRKPVAPGLADIAARLSDRLETRVKVDMGRNKGRITIEVATLEDLQRVIEIIDPS